MLITAKERSIASKSQLKGHAHHYFVSPYYRNSQRPDHNNDCAAIEARRELDSITRLSHPDGIQMAALHHETISPLDATTFSKTGSETSRSLPTEPHPLPARDKPLPAIIKHPSRLSQQRDTNRWLGPPNSIPPNKRNEHVQAYKSRDLTHHVTHPITNQMPAPLRETQSESANDNIPQGVSQNDEHPVLYHRFRSSYHGDRYDDDDQSSASLYPSDSDSNDTYSIASDQQFTHLRFIDKSPATSLQLKSLASHTHRSSTSEQYSTHAGALMLPYGESIGEDLSTMSVHSHETGRRNAGAATRKKVVHFDPQVRDVSRENRSAPLAAGGKTAAAYYGDYPRREETVNYKLDMTPVSESVDQLPAVLEKYMIKSLPVLPNINNTASTSAQKNRSGMNFNANVIYIKEGGGGPSKASSSNTATVTTASKPVLIAKNNVIATSSPRVHHMRPNHVTHQYQQQQQQQQHVVHTNRVHAPSSSSHKGHHHGAAVPQLSRVAEESSNPSLSPSPQLKKQTNKSHVTTTSTATHHHPHSQATSQHSQSAANALAQQNAQQQAALAHASSTKTGSTAKSHKSSKKAAGAAQKTTDSTSNSSSKKNKRSKGRSKGRSSDSSSRNSPRANSPPVATNGESPLATGDDVIDEAELREQRLREYEAAMLKVQQRMREFDLRYGKQPKEEDMAKSQFGKVIPPKGGGGGGKGAKITRK